ncbi:MAG: hypothetical protein J7M14_06640 [Planctomycetes bacterium]|nr:hypothetical protein [Planctomycetota bacterium]
MNRNLTMLIAVLSVAMLTAVGCGNQKAEFEAFSTTVELPATWVPLVDAVVVDGSMDDVYKQATPLTFVFLDGSTDKSETTTLTYVVSTKTALNIFIECQTSDVTAIQAFTEDRDGGIWSDDYVELFLNPTNDRGGTYFQFGVNSIGTVADIKHADGAEDSEWDADIAVKTKVGQKAWTAEISIPFSELGVSEGKVNKVWIANFGRMDQLTGEDVAWCATDSTSSFIPGKFGYLWLEAGDVDNSK